MFCTLWPSTISDRIVQFLDTTKVCRRNNRQNLNSTEFSWCFLCHGCENKYPPVPLFLCVFDKIQQDGHYRVLMAKDINSNWKTQPSERKQVDIKCLVREGKKGKNHLVQHPWRRRQRLQGWHTTIGVIHNLPVTVACCGASTSYRSLHALVVSNRGPVEGGATAAACGFMQCNECVCTTRSVCEAGSEWQRLCVSACECARVCVPESLLCSRVSSGRWGGCGRHGTKTAAINKVTHPLCFPCVTQAPPTTKTAPPWVWLSLCAMNWPSDPLHHQQFKHAKQDSFLPHFDND